MSNSTSFKLETFLPFKLNTAAETITRELVKLCCTKLEVSRAQARVLIMLNEQGTLTARQICDLTYMEKVMVSRAVRDLEARKLIRRKVNKEDKRSMFLSLTAKGQKGVNQIIPLMDDWQKSARKRLGAKNFDLMAEMLDQLKGEDS